ncbi:hypothetical protein CTAYLR_002221 [Chrysophaeum taylorii]|uniref:PNPLA domain-containing protein n=1 Tax=Chrysophaeum taylorii TaxID=2483200 RepID=A0AAD7XQA4_9STRA|nr:hypothetical protein CTAYLR_002221 [Chrysophaeum taylorii]
MSLVLVFAIVATTANALRCDVVLSSGFMCFSSNCGLLDALHEAQIKPSALVGTSSGALTASLVAAGHSTARVAAEFFTRAPIWDCRPYLTPWRGILSLAQLETRLASLLPATFEELDEERRSW